MNYSHFVKLLLKMKFHCHCVCITLVMSSVVVSKTVDFSGNPKVNRTYGGNVTITWNVKSKLNEDVFLNIFVGDTDGERILKQDITSLAQQEMKSFDRSKKSSLEIVNRVSAKYSSDGKKDSNGMIIGEVLFTITNLKFSDSGRYTIASGFNKYHTTNNQTVLDVCSPPVITNSSLNKNYDVSNSKHFTLKLVLFGKPQPVVTWTLGGVPLQTTRITNPSPHNYTYTVIIGREVLPKPCETKQLNYTARGYGSTISGSADIHGIFEQNYVESFTEDVIFAKSNCIRIAWENKIITGKCKTHYELIFLDEDGLNVTNVFVSDIFYRTCDSTVFNASQFKIITSVFDLNGKLIGKDHGTEKNFSQTIKIAETTCSIVHARSTKDIIIIGLSAVIALLLTCIVLLLVRKKVKNTGKANINEDKTGDVDEQSTVQGISSNYMELQPAGIDMNYQDLTVLKFNPIVEETQMRNKNTEVKMPTHYMELGAARKDTIYQALTTC